MTAPKNRPLSLPKAVLIPAKRRVSGAVILAQLERARAEFLEKNGRFLTDDEIRAGSPS